MKRTLLLLIILFFSGCFQQPQIKKIKELKEKKILKNIKYSSLKKYKADIYKDTDNLKYICMNRGNCKDYFDDTEPIFFDKKGYSSRVPHTAKNILCGYGSLTGWLGLLGVQVKAPFQPGFVNYTKMHKYLCNSKFTTIDGYALGTKFIIGALTFMTPFVTGVGVYTKKFDEDKFKEAIFNSKLYAFKNNLINIANRYNISGGFDVIYLNDNFEDVLKEKYNSLFSDNSKKSGVVLIYRKTDSYSIIPFKRYKEDSLNKISLEIKDILKDFSKNNYSIKYEDIERLIPPKIQKPIFPPMQKLVKSEFETKKEFNQRVKKALEQRNKIIKKLKEDYYLAVYKRNLYIDTLKNAYEKYLQEEFEYNKNIINIIKQNIPMLSKYLAMEQFVYNAKKFSYDAENERLYFILYSKNGFNEKAYVKISPDDAKNVKLFKRYKIIPSFNFKNNNLFLNSFKIFSIKTKKLYNINFTNNLFKPNKIFVKIITHNEKLKQVLSHEFSRYKQKPIQLKDDVNIMFIQNINYNSNHKVPKWFINNIPQDKLIAYGCGKTYEEAISNARDELAKMIEIKIQVEYNSNIKFKNFKTLKEINEQTKQFSNVKLTKQDYKIYKQTKLDGLWYVGLEYIKKKDK